MAREIERKFLLRDDSWRSQITHSTLMRQGYLTSSPGVSIRVRVAGSEAFLNLKSATLGISRHEFEYPVPLADAEQMLALFCGERCLDKTRHYLPQPPHTWEIDEFHGANAGLVVAEIELTSETDSFARPAWLGEEVSAERRYYNVCLIDQPYASWR